jgi:hypothetical protein
MWHVDPPTPAEREYRKRALRFWLIVLVVVLALGAIAYWRCVRTEKTPQVYFVRSTPTTVPARCTRPFFFLTPFFSPHREDYLTPSSFSVAGRDQNVERPPTAFIGRRFASSCPASGHDENIDAFHANAPREAHASKPQIE